MAADLVRLLVSRHHADGLDEGVSGVVHARLDGEVQRVPVGRGLVAQLGVDGGRQAGGHAVVVFAQVGVLRTAHRHTLRINTLSREEERLFVFRG